MCGPLIAKSLSMSQESTPKDWRFIKITLLGTCFSFIIYFHFYSKAKVKVNGSSASKIYTPKI